MASTIKYIATPVDELIVGDIVQFEGKVWQIMAMSEPNNGDMSELEMDLECVSDEDQPMWVTINGNLDVLNNGPWE